MLENIKKTLNLSILNICIYLSIFGLGILVGKLITEPTIIKNTVLRESGYKYINPILLCNINNNQKYNENTELSEKLLAYTQENPENEISVYFLNLKNGIWSSVNDSKAYSPASMLKVPTMMETLKYEETNPGILSKLVYYDGSFDKNKTEDIKPSKSIIAGNYYTIDQLLTYMIIYSDNNALQIIHDTLKSDSFKKLYKDLNIEIPQNTIDFMSAKTYALFLRVLYNSTYLTRENSEKAPDLMANKNSFPEGIRPGVPKEIDVAEKFGERSIVNTSMQLVNNELHDCGIVYAEDNPYVLCVMTKGKNFKSLEKNISDISKIVYSDVISK
jgi:beta-lactamase class A